MSDRSMSNARTIVKRLIELAQDSDNRDFIVKDGGCLAGLVKYMKNPDTVVQTMATQTVKLLGTLIIPRKTLFRTRNFFHLNPICLSHPQLSLGS